jgi:hypothetical protein
MKKLFMFFVMMAAMLSVAYGQVTSTNGGSIQGTITDPTGAAVPGAKIVILATETGAARTIITDGAGYYSVGPLIPGAYKVTISATGFQTLSVNTSIRLGTATTGSFKLPVGNSTVTIEVNAGAVQVNTDQAGVSDVLTSQQIDTLPINGRNFLDVAQIEPGVILQSGGSFDPTKAGYSALSIGGVSGRTTRILLDGQDITDETVGTTIFNVSQGSIGEFQINRSTQDVSGDVTSTGQVLVATKSGTNAFHGELFYNFQDARAGAATEFGSQPPFQRNQFGGSVGGPILKEKLFFFGNIERIKQDSSSPAQVASLFPQYQGLNISAPYRETYSTIRLDYNGPLGGHYFVRANYNVNGLGGGNFGEQFETYSNRDNTPGLAGGADFQFGHFTHSFRGSYEKFHNLISDTSSSAPLNLLPGITFQNVTGTAPNLATGPNVDAPQGTFQSDKQARYDGSWTKGTHTIRYGYSINHILGGGFANFFGLGPRLRESSATLFANCGDVAGAAPCPSDPLNGYHASALVIGNNLGFFTENPGFGLLGGGVHDWREGAYVADSWKVTPNFTLTTGVRWSVDTDRANQDLAQIPCSALDPGTYSDPTQVPCTGNDSLLGQFGPLFAGRVHQPNANFGPQIGFAYAPGDHKTVIRAGFGIFYEGDVFNNTTNARSALLAEGPFFAEAAGGSVCGPGKFQNADGTVTSSATVNGTTMSIAQICAAPIGVAAPFVLALSQGFQGIAAKNPLGPNSSFVGTTLNANGLYGAPYRTPYSEQWNLGMQRELFRGAVITADYIHNSTLKIGQLVDINHLGAARFFNPTAANNAIANTLAGFPMCPQGTSAASINCAIANGATIDDFANNGLDSAAQFLGGNSPAANGLTVATGAAFPGQNPLLGSGSFIQPVGRSGYDALQIVFRQQKSHPVPGIERSNLQISYNLSRIVSTSNNTSGDQFFSNLSYSNDNPTAYIGRDQLDRKHQVSFGGSFLLKYGPEIGIIGHFYSALPQTLTLDATSSPVANIYRSDLDGDGTVGDLAPGTLPGDYMHRIKPSNLSNYISNFNATHAGQLTPAGKTLISNGIFTQSQLVALGGVIQRLPNAIVGGTAPANPDYRQVDLTLSYPIRLGHYVHSLGEGVTLSPKIAFYNIGNFSNFGGNSGNPSTAPFQGNLGETGSGSVNSSNDFASVDPLRVTRQSGTFDQGAPRTIEFQLQLTF